MKKLKVYLDSSVMSHLEAYDAVEKMQDTLILWDDIKTGMYDVYLSDVVFNEIERCHEPKKSLMYHYMAQIRYKSVKHSKEIETIADKLINMGILTETSYDDCLHIGSALVASCNYIISWNFRHLVNVKTINGVRAITNLYGYNSVDIITPSMFIIKEN